MAKKEGRPGSLGNELFDPTAFLFGIEGSYKELNDKLKEMGIEPENHLPHAWIDATKTLQTIRQLVEKYKAESKPEKKENIAAHIQKLGVSLRGKISNKAEKAAQEYLDTHPELSNKAVLKDAQRLLKIMRLSLSKTSEVSPEIGKGYIKYAELLDVNVKLRAADVLRDIIPEVSEFLTKNFPNAKTDYEETRAARRVAEEEEARKKAMPPPNPIASEPTPLSRPERVNESPEEINVGLGGKTFAQLEEEERLKQQIAVEEAERQRQEELAATKARLDAVSKKTEENRRSTQTEGVKIWQQAPANIPPIKSEPPISPEARELEAAEQAEIDTRIAAERAVEPGAPAVFRKYPRGHVETFVGPPAPADLAERQVAGVATTEPVAAEAGVDTSDVDPLQRAIEENRSRAQAEMNQLSSAAQPEVTQTDTKYRSLADRGVPSAEATSQEFQDIQNENHRAIVSGDIPAQEAARAKMDVFMAKQHEIVGKMGEYVDDLRTVENEQLADGGIEPTLGGEPEELVEGPLKTERTPAEEKSRLKSLIGALSEKMSAAKENFSKASEKGETKMEFLFTNLGEKYNKLPTWQKITLGGALAVGYGFTLPVSTTAAILYGGALVGTRFAAMAGSFRSNREMLERVNRRAGMGRLENTRLYQWLGSGTETGRKNTAMAKAMLQSFGMTGAMAYTAHELAEHHVGERIGQWFTDYLGGPAAEQAIPPVVLETGAAAPAAPVVPEAPVAEAPAPAPAQSAFQAEVRAVDNQIAAAQMADARAQAAGVGLPESPPSTVPDISVEATPGKGYEFMAKRLWEQLQTQNLDANKFAEGSDMRRLLEATPQDIDKVVHDIAKEHGLFKTEGNLAGSSVQINLGDKLTFNADGSLEVSNGQTYVNAPEGARVTLPYAPESPVAVPIDHTTSIRETVVQYPGTAVSDVTPAADVDSQPPVARVGAPVAGPTTEASLPAGAGEAAPAGTAEQAPPPAHGGSEVPPLPEGNLLQDSQGAAVLDSQGQPVVTSAAETSPMSIEAPPTLSIEHTTSFTNINQLQIDPTVPHIFQDANGSVYTYGNNFASRFTAAQEFVRANHGATVWVQAEKPVFHEGAWRPWAFSVRSGWFGRIVTDIPIGKPDVSHIGAINPNLFTKSLK